ncbi:MAG: sigma-70 family RNA polymerase sigma factor [Planctomycetes bacterium]|nr:sigma-70 family RNA polymerase sigma factor [Planctomycetota bacterium]
MHAASLARTQSPVRTKPAPAAQAAPSDSNLLLAIASAKDRDAFDELHRRYVTPCYNLALNIAGHRETAEEAVQDAMVRIWRFAGGFKPGGNARGWIMQTLAHSCIALLKKNAAECKRERDAAEPLPPAPTPAQDGAARDELLLALRTAVARLPDAERRIVALYFGAELSQAEIGKELDISQRNVSGRLTRALESLRQDLAQGGFAAAAPLLGSGLCAEALTSGQSAPPGLSAAVRAGVREAARESLRATARAGFGFTRALLGLAAAAALAAGAYVALDPAAPPPAASLPGAPEAKSADTPHTHPIKEAPTAETARLHRIWTFEKGIPSDLRLISGRWNWHTPDTNLPGHVATADDAWALLKVAIPPRPVRVRFEFCRLTNQADRGEYGISWIHGRTVPRRTFYEVKSQLKFAERRMVVEMYLFDRVAVSSCNGQINSLLAYDAPYPSGALVLSLANFGLSRVTLDEIGEDEIPAPVREAAATRHQRRSYTRPAVTLEPLND